MEEKMINVSYSDFVCGVKAEADLDSIRAILTAGTGYCSDSIMAVLGLPVSKEKKG